MLKDILKLIYESRMYSKSYISRQLNIPEDMVESAVNQLLNMNFLREDEISPTCGSACSGCPMTNCNINVVKTYTITDKGLSTISS